MMINVAPVSLSHPMSKNTDHAVSSLNNSKNSDCVFVKVRT
jgi:hypothetical protein